MSEEEIKVKSSSSCSSLSGRSTISYEVGSIGDSQFIRLTGNSAGGLFCKEWVSIADVQQQLTGLPSVTSQALKPLYAGKSSNSPGFLAACVINESLKQDKQTHVDLSSKPIKIKKQKNEEKP